MATSISTYVPVATFTPVIPTPRPPFAPADDSCPGNAARTLGLCPLELRIAAGLGAASIVLLLASIVAAWCFFCAPSRRKRRQDPAADIFPEEDGNAQESGPWWKLGSLLRGSKEQRSERHWALARVAAARRKLADDEDWEYGGRHGLTAAAAPMGVQQQRGRRPSAETGYDGDEEDGFATTALPVLAGTRYTTTEGGGVQFVDVIAGTKYTAGDKGVQLVEIRPARVRDDRGRPVVVS